MRKSRLAYLLARYKAEQCSLEELAEMESWYRSLDYSAGLDRPALDSVPTDVTEKEKLADSLFANFERLRLAEQASSPANLRRPFTWQRWAAVFIGFICLSMVSWLALRSLLPDTVLTEPTLITIRDTDDVRFVTLPDSSTVILQPGSTLDFTDGFTNEKRSVKLLGEAFFDVVADAGRPFTIQSDNIKTTVLGTSFSVRAYPAAAEIAVTVKTGKVHVEDEHGFIAILTENKQVVYNRKGHHTAEQLASVAKEHEWVMQGMQFESLALKQIAEKLSKRYNLTIKFSNKSLENCTVTANFDGTEHITEILQVICTTRNAAFTYNDTTREVWIAGEGGC